MDDFLKFGLGMIIVGVVALVFSTISYLTTRIAQADQIVVQETPVYIDDSKYKIVAPDESHQIHHVRISGYTPDNKKTAIGDTVKTGYSCAVSPKCLFMLGKKIYVEGYGVRYVNDLTAAWLDDKFEYCTIDLAVPTKEHAKKIGNTRSRVVIIE